MNDIPMGIPVAPAWSLFAGELGKACIWSAIAFFTLSLLLWIARPRFAPGEGPAKLCFTLGALCLFGAFASLAALFIKDQFQFQYVFEHGDSSTDLKYKISGIWNSQEGSFLLWACTSALFGLLTVGGTGPYRRWYTVVYCGFLICLSAILAYETPFNLMKEAMAHGKVFVFPRGAGMTPSLQNYWDVIHPPTIFTGFGSLTVFFAYAAAALLKRDASDWVSRVRPWALVTTGILGLGICMGGLWAYETQGWGGFWAWDPVEVASFIPWLFTVIFVHGVLVQVSRHQWVRANLLLGGLPFLSFAYGTFLTRSGLLDKVSVHSFATMDSHALGILRWFMIGFAVAFGVLFAVRGKAAASTVPAPEAQPEGLHREGFYRFGMTIIGLLAVVLALGMSWPVIAALRGGEGSKVDEWLYHLVVVWFFIPVMLTMAVAPFVSWKAMGGRVLMNRFFSVLCVAVGLTGFLQMALMWPATGVHADPTATVGAPFGWRVSLQFWMLALVFLCMFVAVANAWRVGELAKRSPGGIGGFIAHIGLAILLGGLILSRGYEQKDRVFVRPGSPPVTALGYQIAYKDTNHLNPFDRNGKVFFDVRSPDGESFVADPGMYMYGDDDPPKWMVWPHIQRSPSHDVYLSMAQPQVQAWSAPMTVRPGEKTDVDGTTIEYLRPTQKGKPGTMGVTFGAVVRLTEQDDDGQTHQYEANPSVQLTDQGLNPSMPQIGPNFRIAIVGGVDPADRSVPLMLYFFPPIYPIELFYKPLTGLVWLGAIVMTSGGLLSAWSRRRVTVREKAKAKQKARVERREPVAEPSVG